MTLPPFRVRLDVMLAALRADPRVEVLDVVVRPPATDGALADAEAAIGLPLPPDLRRFYAAHDGVFVQWGVRGRTYKDRSAPFDYPDYDQPPGCINLLPVGEAMSPTWEEHDHVNEVQPEHQALLFGAPLDPQPPVRAVCVDNFSKYQHGDLILGPAPVMVVSTDHGADLESSDFCSVATYLDLTLAVFGADRYDHGLGIGWTRDPQRVDAWTRPADLDTIVRALLTDPE